MVETNDKPSKRILEVPSCDFRGGNCKTCGRCAASDQEVSYTKSQEVGSEIDGGDAITNHV